MCFFVIPETPFARVWYIIFAGITKHVTNTFYISANVTLEKSVKSMLCLFSLFLTHYQMTNFLDWSNLKQIADDILKCIYNEK